ncbi:hypothetical protein SFMTTN_2876 [Sulfuriferula multivorans]|uniref:Uncharacterized protein n=1 Tax=Sulfuriferula multivorans TaxID=1559896 RepID=A0A401JZI1_9PROT|nr:hypothetical protein SFMTTN_2876 [Sulfuriferula multivorans]
MFIYFKISHIDFDWPPYVEQVRRSGRRKEGTDAGKEKLNIECAW